MAGEFRLDGRSRQRFGVRAALPAQSRAGAGFGDIAACGNDCDWCDSLPLNIQQGSDTTRLVGSGSARRGISAAIGDGEVFGDAVFPTFQAYAQDDDRCEASAPMHNPYGRWRLVPIDSQQN
jgi:hypothetical protein